AACGPTSGERHGGFPSMSIPPPPVPRRREITYPETDGRPIGETDIHIDDRDDVVGSLRVFYAGDPNVYVSGGVLIFYEEGNRRKHVAPDVFVIHGVPKRRRNNYLIWAEGKGPDLV